MLSNTFFEHIFLSKFKKKGWFKHYEAVGLFFGFESNIEANKLINYCEIF